MEDRVHQRDFTTDEENPAAIHARHSTDDENPDSNPRRSTASLDPETPGSVSRPILEKSPPPVESYVVQIPKDQIYRVPSPRAAARYEKYIRNKPRNCGCCCCRCCWCLFAFIFIVLLVIGIAIGIFFIVVHPKTPNYSVENLSIEGFNLTTTQTLYPEFDVSVKANNPNKKIGFYYESGSSVTISHSNVELSNGSLPVFYQPIKNVTVFKVKLTGSLTLPTALSSTLKEEQNAGMVPLVLNIRVPVKLKIGSLHTWKFKVNVNCDIVVNNLSENSKIVSKSCGASLKL
ncbi:hypothetical protein NE237_005132 [Protea cynaroides]|uniref:Late embryogenesis abundant protein LEA-2 subgroup domain-containing protein n=1 Tax=Protea cynaroides TaxID=273540 RepID=A0A9Q0KJX8_9MAGN|nr:hypothetical protein NE237_005132 [Protea cynaroides]